MQEETRTSSGCNRRVFFKPFSSIDPVPTRLLGSFARASRLAGASALAPRRTNRGRYFPPPTDAPRGWEVVVMWIFWWKNYLQGPGVRSVSL